MYDVPICSRPTQDSSLITRMVNGTGLCSRAFRRRETPGRFGPNSRPETPSPLKMYVGFTTQPSPPPRRSRAPAGRGCSGRPRSSRLPHSTSGSRVRRSGSSVLLHLLPFTYLIAEVSFHVIDKRSGEGIDEDGFEIRGKRV